ncbi:BapA prefix-like domain-containing protein [Pseudomonas aeruginosa]|nr:BapA prefix-like domain-containing protein [Pseudomonas aeruginosa]
MTLLVLVSLVVMRSKPSNQGLPSRFFNCRAEVIMVQISLINMNSGKLVEQMAGGSIEVQLPSIVKVSLSPEALKSYYRSGNDLIIELKSGEEIVLKDFFIVSADGQRNELVLEDNGRFWHATNGQNEASLSLKEITGIDELLLGESSDNTYIWLLGAIALGGGVAALASGGGGGLSLIHI